MNSLLSRHWFLLSLTAGVACAVAFPGAIGPLTAPLPPHLTVAVALFLMGWTMPSGRLGGELTRPWAALWAMAVGYGFLPAFAWLVGGLSPSPDLRVGLMLAASVPCTLASCILWTRLAGGNEATALVAVLGCTLAGWFVAPLWLAATTSTVVALDPTAMMRDLAVVLLVPVGLGQCARLWPTSRRFADARKKPLSSVAQAFILAIVLKTSAQVGDRLHSGDAALSAGALIGSAGLAMFVHVAALYFGYWSAAWIGIDRPRRIAVAFCGSQKTLPVSVLLFETTFQDDFPLAVVPLLFFHVGQLLFDTMVASRWKNEPRLHESEAR